jgi:hypothetical protein
MPRKKRKPSGSCGEISLNLEGVACSLNGDVVWGKVDTHPWWPAVFFESWEAMFEEWDLPPIEEAKRAPISLSECVVYFLGEESTRYNVLDRSKIQPFDRDRIETQPKAKQKFRSKQKQKQFEAALGEVRAYLQEISDVHKDVGCEVCGRDDDDDKMLLCGDGEVGCDKGFHIHCLTPALPALPDGHWYCPSCKITQENKKSPIRSARYTFTSVGHRPKKLSWKSPEYASGLDYDDD